MMRVVSGALIRDGQVLMGLRKAKGYRPNLWELPGGKVEPGESPAEALQREWREECYSHVHVREFISMAMMHMDISFVIELYRVELAALPGRTDNEPRALDHQELRWVDPLDAVKWMPCSPAFYLHYPQLQPLVEATRPTSSCDFMSDAGCTDPNCQQCHPRPPWERTAT